jgi:hypothetical protein
LTVPAAPEPRSAARKFHCPTQISRRLYVSDQLIAAVTGANPALLREDVTLATPLTLPRIVGRDNVVAALRAYAGLFAPAAGDLHLSGDELEGAVLSATVDGHLAQIVALVSRDRDGLVASVDIYGRPWPYMAIVRDRLASVDPALADPSLGATPYVPDGPGTTWVAAPDLPPLSETVTFLSPLLTAEASGKALAEKILGVAVACYGEQKFRAVLPAVGQPAVAGVFDGAIEGNALQLVAIFTLDGRSEVAEIRIFTRPWPITASLRREMHELLRDDLGAEYWQGPPPDGPLPIR